MIRSRYPRTSDVAVLAAQRGAALAKGIAAIGLLIGLIALGVLAARDVQQPAEGRSRSDLNIPTAARPAAPANAKAIRADDNIEGRRRLDPQEGFDDLWNTQG